MNINEIREKSIAQLHKDFLNIKKDLVQEVLNLKIGKIKSTSKKKEFKLTLARIKTIISQKERENKHEKA